MAAENVILKYNNFIMILLSHGYVSCHFLRNALFTMGIFHLGIITRLPKSVLLFFFARLDTYGFAVVSTFAESPKDFGRTIPMLFSSITMFMSELGRLMFLNPK